jgi:diguanylate cyclase (GGDEF)-like protein/PAS domain S-box-containing protein
MLPRQRRPSTAVSPADPAALPGRPGRAIAAVGFLTGLVMVVFGIAAWEDVNDDFATRGATITTLAARSVRLFYRQFEDTLDSLSTEILDERLLDDPRGARRALERTAAAVQGLHALRLVDARGRVVADVVEPGVSGVGPVAPDAVRASGSRLEVGRPVPDHPGGPWVVPMRLVHEGGSGHPRFTLLAATAVDDQWRLVSDLVVPQGWFIGMRRDDASLQARWPMPPDPAAMFGRSLPGPLARALAERPGLRAGTVAGVSPVDGQNRIFVFQRVADYPFQMFVSIPRESLWWAWADRMRLPVTLFLLLAIGGLWVHRRLDAQQRRHTAEVSIRQSRLELLHRIAADVIDARDARGVLQTTLHELSQRYPGFRASYALLDDDALSFVASVRAGDREAVEGRITIGPDSARALSAGRLLMFPDTPAVGGLEGAWSLAPVALPEESTGVLCLDVPGPRPWIQEQADTLRETASQLAMACRNDHAETLRAAAEARLRSRVDSYRRLAEISSDWFWETDAEHRFRWNDESAWHPAYTRLAFDRSGGLRRWETPGNRFDPEVLRRHRAQLEAREAFRDLEYERDLGDGEIHHLTVSGTPVFDVDGRFAGYRGLGRDITLRRRAEQALRASESVFSAVFAGSRDALFLGDVATGRILDCNPRAVTLFEADDREQLVAMRGPDLLARRLPLRELARGRARLEQRLGVRRDLEFRTCRGRAFWGETVVARLDVPQAPMHLVRVADVSERKQAEALLRQSEQRFRDLSELSSDWFWEQDADLRFTGVTTAPPGATENWRDGAMGRQRWEQDVILDLDDPKWDEHRRLLAARRPFRDFVFCFRGRDGIRWASISGKPVLDEQGGFVGYRGTGRDITERKAAEERIRFLAQHDGLTGLPNRISLQLALVSALERMRRHGRRLAVMFIDLDRFKLVNDTLGHSAGDVVLRDVARRLERCLRSVDLVARQGGDEFVVIVEDFTTEADLAGVAAKLLDACAEPFVIEDQEFALSGSIGISTYPGDGTDIETLLKTADIAMYRAKESGRNRFEFYAPHLATHPPERLSLETALKRAVERGELQLLYQPKLEIATGVVAGAEALVRWEHPELGLLLPSQFIPMAEETGLVTELGNWVLAESSRQLRSWHDAGLRDLAMAVNVSARQFAQGRLVQDVIGILECAGVAPGSIELEITESTVMRNPAHAAALLAALDDLGVGIAIDDFGTGYSSLAYLKRFPVDTLKIDRSFIQALPEDAEDVAITQAVLALARSLRLRVVAEGVEMPRQLVFLAAHGCDFAQGFSIAPPMAADAFQMFARHLGMPSRAGGAAGLAGSGV